MPRQCVQCPVQPPNPEQPLTIDVRCTGFTIVDCLALGTLGHVTAIGIVLGLKATGSL